jgi:hypothetical protein
LSFFAPVRRGGKSYRADHNFFARKKNSSQSRKDAKDLSERISGTIPLYLCVLSAAADRSIRLCEKKKEIARKVGKVQRIGNYFFGDLRLCENKKRLARKDAKPQRPPEGRQARWNHASLEMIKNQLKV